MKPLLSIVIVSWNCREFLMNCLQSIRRDDQTIDSLNIIIVDNGSKDGTIDAVRKHDSLSHVIENIKNIGFAAANNLGIKSEQSKYIALVNPDVTVKAGCLKRLCQVMDANPKIGLAGPRILNADGTLQKSHWRIPTLRDKLVRAIGLEQGTDLLITRHALGTDVIEVGVLSGCFWIVRRDALADVGLLDEGYFMYAEDTDWCKRFWKAGWAVAYVPSAEATHFGGGSSANTPIKSYIEMHRANLRYWYKHHGPLGLSVVYLIMLLHQLLRVVVGGLLFLVAKSKREALRPIIRRCLACLAYLFALPRHHAA